jgi:hypothetical protein
MREVGKTATFAQGEDSKGKDIGRLASITHSFPLSGFSSGAMLIR